MSEYQPVQGEGRGRAFKEAADMLAAEGPAAQAKFLVENVEQYPKHADQVLLNLIPKVEMQMREASAKLADRARLAVESGMLARYYKEYSALSERQKTLRGFGMFVEKRFREDATSGDTRNSETLKRLLARAGKIETRRVPDTVFEHKSQIVSTRENYERSAIKHGQELQALMKTVEDCVAALKGIEERFGYELVDKEVTN